MGPAVGVDGRQPAGVAVGSARVRRLAQVADILVNGPPWRTRVAVRAWDHSPDGTYTNRAVAWLELRWGRLQRWEDYEDTERVAAWDRVRDAARAPV
ncbi:MAG TPA: hypothetical protein PKA98_19120 [Acidimicrobiales bacterium]|nr:hypothetical protein [Acidimicrobiales bacterium]